MSVQQEIVAISINLSSLNVRIVSGVVPGSHAELTGMQNGDNILKLANMGYS